MASCNGCSFIETVESYKSRRKDLVIHFNPAAGLGWPTLYLLGDKPCEGQGKPYEIEGRPARFITSYGEIAHSHDEDCWMPKRAIPKIRVAKAQGA